MRCWPRSDDVGSWLRRAPGLILAAAVVLALLGFCHGHRTPIAALDGAGGAATVSSPGHATTCATPAAAAAVAAPRVLTGDADGTTTETTTVAGQPGRPFAHHRESAVSATPAAPHGWALLILLSVFRK